MPIQLTGQRKDEYTIIKQYVKDKGALQQVRQQLERKERRAQQVVKRATAKAEAKAEIERQRIARQLAEYEAQQRKAKVRKTVSKAIAAKATWLPKGVPGVPKNYRLTNISKRALNYQYAAKEYTFSVEGDEITSIDLFQAVIHSRVTSQMLKVLKRYQSYKVVFRLIANMVREGHEGDIKEIAFASGAYNGRNGRKDTTKPILNANSVYKTYNDCFDDLKTRIEEFQNRGSGWRLVNVVSLSIKVVRFAAFHGFSHMPLPDWVNNAVLTCTTRTTVALNMQSLWG
jgi:hypothetical protein